MSAPCARLWEVEAERDGRLDDDARASATRHRAHCRACREEHTALHSLGRRLADEEGPAWDALAQKRLRGKVLAGANEARLRAPSSHKRVAAFVAFAAVMVIGLVAWKRAPTGTPPAPIASIELRDEGGAVYERATLDGTEHVYLRAGTLGIKVRHDAVTHLLLHVPDGEIEDLGTTFHVSVHGGATTRVSVDEGRVLVRKANGDRDGRLVSAGETWEPDPALEKAATQATVTTPIPASAAPTSAVVLRGPSPEPKPALTKRAVPAPPASASASASAPAGSAVHPPSEEDATYMRAVSLLRAGRRDEARAAARRYVVLYPNGLRRQEMDVVAE